MHIIENWNCQVGKTYCSAAECIWNKETHKYDKPRIPIGKLEGEPPSFIPNKFFVGLLEKKPSNRGRQDNLIIATAVEKYGESILDFCNDATRLSNEKTQSTKVAKVAFTGPSMVFGGITERYNLDAILQKSFGEDAAKDIISLAWYLVSEGAALTDNDPWLDQFENPRGRSISSQDITRLLDRMSFDGIMAFYKEWLASREKINDRVLYDLTSISWSGTGIVMAGWGHNRDGDELPQMNFALLCERTTAMPLFAWPLDGSISDTRTLQNTLQFLEKLGYKVGCLMMDRGFSSQENIDYMLNNGHKFLQALRLGAGWIQDIIDMSRLDRLNPDSILKVGDRTYYASTTKCQWVDIEKRTKKGWVEAIEIDLTGEDNRKKYKPIEKSDKVISQHSCLVHVLYCQDLVGKQWDRFMENLKEERERLLKNEKAGVKKELSPYFEIEKTKYSRQRTVGYNMENIEKHRNRYSGHLCFITNDDTIKTAESALSEYSTRDYIEKDFDELKNDLDMKKIRVHTDGRMCGRLLIQFIAEIILREIRIKLRNSDSCKKLTKRQIASHIKGILKITFKGKSKSVNPELTKFQREILDALGLLDIR